MNNCDVSVLIPAYKSSVTIGRAIRSVLNQAQPILNFTVQVVVVDDCPEQPTKITDDLREKIKFIQHPQNTGLAGALNTALDAAEGKYCYALGSDDWLEPGSLFQTVQLAEKWAGYFVVGGVKYWGQRSDVLLPDDKPEYFSHNAGGAILYPRDAGIRYHTFEAAHALEDWDMALQLIEAGYLPHAFKGVLLNYILHDRGLHANSIKHEAALLKELKARHPKVTAEVI